MIHPDDVERLLEVASQTLRPAKGSRPGQSDYVAQSSAGGQLVVVQVDGVCDVEEHVHAYDEFCMVLKGRITTWIGGKAVVCLPGDLLYEPADIPHRARIEGPYAAIDVFGGSRFKTD
jgi:quercetin dioxygenase-like cupin family protein